MGALVHWFSVAGLRNLHRIVDLEEGKDVGAAKSIGPAAVVSVVVKAAEEEEVVEAAFHPLVEHCSVLDLHHRLR